MSGVKDNRAKNRFELEENGHIAFADYHRRERVLTIPHVEAPPELQGTGAAGRLMEGLLTIARTEGLKVRPSCPYAASYVARHPQWRDILA